MAIPLESGATWERNPDIPPLSSGGRSLHRWVRTVDEPRIRALFKTPDPKRPDLHPNEIYSCGMERVAYTLGTMLGLPMPEVWLETFEGEAGCIMRQIVGGRDLPSVGKAILMLGDIENGALRPLAVVFDIWMANVDRKPANLMFEPLPEGTQALTAPRSRFWLIDNGHTGLFPPTKLRSPTPMSPPQDVVINNGHMEVGWERYARSQMPSLYKEGFLRADAKTQQDAIDQVQAIGDDDIGSALSEIPDTFITEEQAEKTVELLKRRRESAEALMSAHW